MGTHDECEDEYSIEVDSIVAEAEERSSRRAAAIRGVLAQIRGNRDGVFAQPPPPDELPPLPMGDPFASEAKNAPRSAAKLVEEVQEEEPLPQPRAHPPPA